MLIEPDPLPEHLTSPIDYPALPAGQISNYDLMQLIAHYHRLLEQANADRLVIKTATD